MSEEKRDNPSGDEPVHSQRYGWKRKNNLMRGLKVLFIAGAIAILIPTAAGATNWNGNTGYTGCFDGNMQDSSYVTWYRDNVRVRTRNAIEWNFDNNVDPTDLTVAGESSSATSTTDIVFMDGNYTSYCNYDWHSAGFVIGAANCQTLLYNGTCEQFEVRFDTSFMNGQPTGVHRHVVCHETGHALGLGHKGDSFPGEPTQKGCMPSALNLNDLRTNYTNHDITHLNLAY